MRPSTTEELVGIIADAAASGRKLEIVGGGTKAEVGAPRGAERLDMTGFSGVIDYDPAELVLTAGAGTPLDEIEALVASKGQMLAFEPHGAPGSTVGGVAAAGVSGLRRVSRGAVRDHLLGFKAVSGRGEAFVGGAKVVKNVTGYDLPKLMAGSWGTLCALTEVTMKVMPAPETTATLLLFGLSDEAAGAAMREAMRSPLDISGAAHLPADVAGGSALTEIASLGASVTLLRLEGFAESVSSRLTELAAAATVDRAVLDPERSEAAWAEIRDVHLLAEPRERIVWRLSLPPTDGARAMAHIRTAAPAALGYYDWSGGLLWVSVPLSEHGSTQVIRGAIAPASGHATLIRGPEALRSSVFVFEPLPDPLAKLTERVKHAFDPHGILNPGRMYHFA
jgi:glycolate oxidase FAD binding subunit